MSKMKDAPPFGRHFRRSRMPIFKVEQVVKNETAMADMNPDDVQQQMLAYAAHRDAADYYVKGSALRKIHDEGVKHYKNLAVAAHKKKIRSMT